MNKERLDILSKTVEETKKYIENGCEIPIEFKKILFPSFKRECELIYDTKETSEEIISKIIPVPLQESKRFEFNDSFNSSDWVNKLIFGDNLQVLKTLLKMKKEGNLKNSDGTDGIRLIYIDPPFSTRKDFKTSGEDQKAYADKIHGAKFLEWLRKRLVILKELLSDDGCIFVHLDYRKVHYVKVLMDEIYGENNFVNEIIWQYYMGGKGKKEFAKKHDTILMYSNNKNNRVFNALKVKRYLDFVPTLKDTSKNAKSGKDKIGYYSIVSCPDVWSIKSVFNMSNEYTTYPTQKPEELLVRIIEVCSNSGDLILDCFAGSGTTPVVAEKLNRRWIAVDVGKFSIYTIQKRLLHINLVNKTLSPFVLYTAGLYDEERLNCFDEENWKLFAMQLWGCTPTPTKIKNFLFDGNRYGDLVKVFTPHELKQLNAKVSYETLNSIYQRVGHSAGDNLFIIAPKGQFTFAEDIIEINGVNFNILRIPYSMLARFTEEFTAPLQPKNSNNINEAVESVGFDFIQPPFIDFKIDDNFIIINKFKSNSKIAGEEKADLSMVLIDYNYDGEVFDLDDILYSETDFVEGKAKFNKARIDKKGMLIFVDTSGNEKRVVINGK
ncbi:MAG: site-specific DNA-methyltransferase [Bacilli bacterium]|nr:site-specific DNA-methyltransferase [Bacilli bacterium]MDD4718859.1 site-specific DNA-methyltransferase [Bacilli bacterium]